MLKLSGSLLPLPCYWQPVAIGSGQDCRCLTCQATVPSPPPPGGVGGEGGTPVTLRGDAGPSPRLRPGAGRPRGGGVRQLPRHAAAGPHRRRPGLCGNPPNPLGVDPRRAFPVALPTSCGAAAWRPSPPTSPSASATERCPGAGRPSLAGDQTVCATGVWLSWTWQGGGGGGDGGCGRLPAPMALMAAGRWCRLLFTPRQA